LFGYFPVSVSRLHITFWNNIPHGNHKVLYYTLPYLMSKWAHAIGQNHLM